ncbi:hypothetical protein E0Z10_g6942 [Xylaria hypoxylon]|uniref:Uncharacterized protein n=1 Tax=Xylaria hypoxylon TaxID=37992 RepID=A0A4Z0YR11_9PEZI|nr:hypothetical protein E0Z10_g6942 [Xylaria hypoxylon]
MISSASASRARDPMVGISSDGATDSYTLRELPTVIPRYNINENGKSFAASPSPRQDINTTPADTVPKYTREYLQKLSIAVHTRLKMIDDEIAYYEESLAKMQKLHKYLMGVLVILGILWLITSIIVLVAVCEGHGLGRKPS